MRQPACLAPSNCWFGGNYEEPPSGPSGAFHLRWDGTRVTSSYSPQGRAVSDLEAHGSTIVESVLAGRRDSSSDAATPTEPEPEPRLLHRLNWGSFVNDPFVPAQRELVDPDTVELLALDSDGARIWAAGGRANSGSGRDAFVQRPPLLAVAESGGFAEVPIPDDAFPPNDRFVDVAAVPGEASALVAVVQHLASGSAHDRRARVARIDADGNVEHFVIPPASEPPRGDAARIACAGPNDCWLATVTGWLFHYTDGTARERDTDPAFARVVTYRPPDARTPQGVPATPVVDEQAEPPVVAETAAETDEGATAPRGRRRAQPVLFRARSELVGRRTLRVSFVMRKAMRVGLIAKRGRRTVARAKLRTLRRGKRAIRLRLDPQRWPNRLAFVIREPRRERSRSIRIVVGQPARPGSRR